MQRQNKAFIALPHVWLYLNAKKMSRPGETFSAASATIFICESWGQQGHFANQIAGSIRSGELKSRETSIRLYYSERRFN